MSIDEWITVAVLAGMVIVLATDRIPAAYAVFSATVGLLVLGVIEPNQAFAGFSSTAPITIAALYVVAGALEKTGALLPVVDVILRPVRSQRGRVAQLTVPVGVASAFVANTPIVAMLVPPVSAAADRQRLARSKLLIPLSYASILGGVVTAIGTSTNLLVSSLLEESGDSPLGVFEISKLGLPVALIGLVFIIGIGPTLMPDRTTPAAVEEDEVREFSLAMTVDNGGPVAGRTVEEAGLRHLDGMFLVEITRGEDIIAPVHPDEGLLAGDLLTFVGRAEQIVDLQRMRGLTTSEMEHALAVDTGAHQFFECVVGVDSLLNGARIKDIGFRGRYQAAVIAVHRSGQRVSGKIGEITLRGGDTLMVLAGRDFKARTRNNRDFLLVARLGGHSLAASRLAPWVLGVLALVVALPALGLMTLLESSLLAALGLVGSRVLTATEARESVQTDVVVMIGASFGLGAAVRQSGLSERIADALVGGLGSFGDAGAVLGLVVATIVLTELVTNSAAAVIAVPIALDAAARTGLDPRTMVIAVAVAASCSFLTPIGYQTNTMVYGPGGYRYIDYLRLGIPLTVIVVVSLTFTVVALG